MIKAKLGDAVRSKTDTAMTNEALCKVLDAPLLVSGPVARHLAGCRSLGRHPLRGVGEPMELFSVS